MNHRRAHFLSLGPWLSKASLASHPSNVVRRVCRGGGGHGHGRGGELRCRHVRHRRQTVGADGGGDCRHWRKAVQANLAHRPPRTFVRGGVCRLRTNPFQDGGLRGGIPARLRPPPVVLHKLQRGFRGLVDGLVEVTLPRAVHFFASICCWRSGPVGRPPASAGQRRDSRRRRRRRQSMRHCCRGAHRLFGHRTVACPQCRVCNNRGRRGHALSTVGISTNASAAAQHTRARSRAPQAGSAPHQRPPRASLAALPGVMGADGSCAMSLTVSTTLSVLCRPSYS